MSIEPVDECRCRGDEVPGPHGTFWCQYHQCRKTQHYRDLCRGMPGYRKLWNEGHGPGQGLPNAESQPATEGLGDVVARWMSAVGVTEENYKAIKQMFGLPPRCNCKGRKEWLNRVGRWLKEKI